MNASLIHPAFEPGGYGRLPEDAGADADELDLNEPWPEDEVHPARPAPLPDLAVELWAEITVPAQMLGHYQFACFGHQLREVISVQRGVAPGQVQIDLAGGTFQFGADQPVVAALPRAIRARDLREGQTVMGPWQMPLTASRVQSGRLIHFELLGAEQVFCVSAAPDEWIQIP